MNLGEAFNVAVKALGGPDRDLTAAELEAAILERGARRRAFRRLSDDEMAQLLS